MRKAAITNPVVTLTGPRQSGKTTLVRAAFGDHCYVSLEAPGIRMQALEDPRSLLTLRPLSLAELHGKETIDAANLDRIDPPAGRPLAALCGKLW